MNLYLLSFYNSLRYGSYTDYFAVMADSEEKAREIALEEYKSNGGYFSQHAKLEEFDVETLSKPVYSWDDDN